MKYYHLFYWMQYQVRFKDDNYAPDNDICDIHPLLWEKNQNDEIASNDNTIQVRVILASWQEIDKETYDLLS